MIAPPLVGRAPRAGLALAAAAVLLAGVEARAQRRAPTVPPDGLDLRVTEWQKAARAHVGGQFDGPAATIAEWPPELTDAVVAQVIRSWPGSVAKGLILHTDIAIAKNSGVAAQLGTVDAFLLDDKPIASRWFSNHWSHARVLADALRKEPAAAPARDGRGPTSIRITGRWYRAAGALFQQWAYLGHLEAHLVHSRSVLGDDPVLLVYEGTLHQTFADARFQVYRAGRLRSLLDQPEMVRPRLLVESASRELDIAERALRRALALDASLVEARIRLAHVLEVRGKLAEAIALARQALTEPLPPFLEYYGAMVLGRAEATLGHPADARAAFERAAARYPHSQTTRVALSHITDSPGAASDDLVRALGPDAQEASDDPWSQYFRLHEPDAQALLEALRAEVK